MGDRVVTRALLTRTPSRTTGFPHQGPVSRGHSKLRHTAKRSLAPNRHLAHTRRRAATGEGGAAQATAPCSLGRQKLSRSLDGARLPLEFPCCTLPTRSGYACPSKAYQMTKTQPLDSDCDLGQPYGVGNVITNTQGSSCPATHAGNRSVSRMTRQPSTSTSPPT